MSLTFTWVNGNSTSSERLAAYAKASRKITHISPVNFPGFPEFVVQICSLSGTYCHRRDAILQPGFLFVILAAGATLHVSGKTDIQSATDAAQALRPLGGNFATVLFGIGLIEQVCLPSRC